MEFLKYAITIFLLVTCVYTRRVDKWSTAVPNQPKYQVLSDCSPCMTYCPHYIATSYEYCANYYCYDVCHPTEDPELWPDDLKATTKPSA